MDSTNELQNLYYENYKLLLKETREDLNEWKGIPCSCIVRQQCYYGYDPQLDLQIPGNCKQNSPIVSMVNMCIARYC